MSNRSGAISQVQISHKNFRNIGLIGRPDKYSVVETLCLIHDHILALGLHPVFDSDTAQLVPYNNTQTVSRALLGEVVDLVIVVGGDGSLLHAARALVKYTIKNGAAAQAKTNAIEQSGATCRRAACHSGRTPVPPASTAYAAAAKVQKNRKYQAM